jgi:hypothetical protein
MVVLEATRQLKRIRHEQAAMAELPITVLACLMANINRDPKKGTPFKPQDFAVFGANATVEHKVFTPEVAATALALRHEGLAPSILLTAWPELLASLTEDAKPPEQRAWASDDGQVWVLCPQWEGQHVRCGLVAVHGTVHGPVLLRDVDRKLLSYRLVLPEQKGFGWLQAGLLLLQAVT